MNSKRPKFLNIDRKVVCDSFEYSNGRLYWKIKAGSKRVGDEAGHLSYRHGGPRWVIGVNSWKFLRSRIVWTILNGDIPENMEIDHINRDRLDDRIENLRLSTRSQNLMNTKVKHGQSGFRNVLPYIYRGQVRCYRSYIKIDGRRVGLGKFDTAKEAYQAFLIAAKSQYGGFVYEQEN